MIEAWQMSYPLFLLIRTVHLHNGIRDAIGVRLLGLVRHKYCSTQFKISHHFQTDMDRLEIIW